MHIELKLLEPRLYAEEFFPCYKTEGAAAIDLRACIDKPIHLAPGEQVKVSTGIAIDLLSPDYVALCKPRSGSGSRGLVLGNSTGVIDSDYQGPIELTLWHRPWDANNGEGHITQRGEIILAIEPLERVAQMLILPVKQPELKLVEEFSRQTDRGAGGFGSTGRI